MILRAMSRRPGRRGSVPTPIAPASAWFVSSALIGYFLAGVGPAVFAASRAADPVVLVTSTEAGTRFVVQVPELRFVPVTDSAMKDSAAKGAAGVEVEADGFLPASPPGAPAIPAQRVLVAIPKGARPELRFTIEGEHELVIPGGSVAPVPVPGARPAGEGPIPHEPVPFARIPDPEAYAAPYPRARVAMGAVEQLRDLYVVSILVWPAVVDPARGTLRVAERIAVEVSTSGGRPQTLRPALPAPTPPAELLLAPVVNPGLAAQLVAARGSERSGVRGAGTVGFESSPHWVRVQVSARGLTRITGSALAATGTDVPAIDPTTFRIFWGGGLDPEPGVSARSSTQPTFMRECAIEVTGTGDGRFDAADAITFLGQGASGWRDDLTGAPYELAYHETQMNRTGVYWLTWGGVFPDSPLRIASRDAAPQGGAPVVDRGRARFHYERNLRYLSDLYERGQKWERWFDAVVPDTDPTVFFPFTAVKPVTSEPGSLRLRLWGFTFAGALPPSPPYDHYAKVWFNTQAIMNPNPAFADTFAWHGPRFAYSGRMDIGSDAVPVVDGQNRVLLDVLVVPNPGGAVRQDQVAMAWYDAGYTRRLDFAGETGGEVVPVGTVGLATVEIVNTSAGARVYDVSDPYLPVELSGVERAGTTVRFTAAMNDADPPKFLVGTPTQAPASLVVDTSQPNLRRTTHSAWYVVIAHDSMVQEAVRLANAHAAVEPPEGPLPGTPLVVRASDVYDEFGWGLKSEIAIRNFIDYATYAWADGPRYVCLLGDASYDALDIFGGGQRETDFVPAGRSWNFIGGEYGGSEFLSDDYYVRTFGDSLETRPDQITDLIVGRLPAGSVEEARVMVDEKTIPLVRGIECGDWRQRVVLAADDEMAGNPPVFETFVHTEYTELIGELLPPELERKKVYLLDYQRDATGSKPEARAAFIAAFNEGAGLINYMGHGSPVVLAHEAMFRVDNVGQLTNGTGLPIFSTYSCTVNRFDEVDEEGIGEALVGHRGGGSAASIGSTDLAFVSTNLSLNSATYSRFYPGDDLEAPTSIGAALASAKNSLSVPFADTAGIRKYVLLGDPALVPPTVKRRFQLRIPGAVTQGDTVRLTAGVPYQLEGYFPGGGAGTFTAELEVRDSDALQSRLHGASATFYFLPGNPVFRSRIGVTGDTLRAPIVVPIDASQSLSLGRGAGQVRVYVDACPLEIDGLGWAPLFLDVEGAQPVEPDSDGGPDIAVDFDPSAGAVPPNSQLTIRIEDKSGINIVGNTPSNTVFMRLDEVTTVNLNDRFAYESGSATAGRVDYPFAGLTEGHHVLRVVASDNYLNRTEVEVPFTVVVPGQMAIRKPGLYPNPFAPAAGQGTVIAFDLPEPSEVDLRVFAVSGRLIREDFPELDSPVGAGPRQIYWDGRDEEGDLVANGVYLCSISARSLQSGERAEVILRSVVQR